jgi:hypothetical protein
VRCEARRIPVWRTSSHPRVTDRWSHDRLTLYPLFSVWLLAVVLRTFGVMTSVRIQSKPWPKSRSEFVTYSRCGSSARLLRTLASRPWLTGYDLVACLPWHHRLLQWQYLLGLPWDRGYLPCPSKPSWPGGLYLQFAACVPCGVNRLSGRSQSPRVVRGFRVHFVLAFDAGSLRM